MKKIIMYVLRCFLFSMLVLGGIMYLSQFYANRTNAEYNYQAFSELKENPDVLVFGSSYTEVAFDPNELYRQTGITSYNLSASGQKLDTTYYVLQTVLEYKNPKAVMFVMDDIDIIKGSSTLDGEILAVRDLRGIESDRISYLYDHFVSNRRLSQVISADYFRRKHLSQSAVNDADAHYIGSNRRLSRAYFSSAEAGLK